jgi:hypothetical protein
MSIEKKAAYIFGVARGCQRCAGCAIPSKADDCPRAIYDRLKTMTEPELDEIIQNHIVCSQASDADKSIIFRIIE